MKFSPPGSRVDVVLRDGVLTVTDEGVGLADGEAERVFDRFWRSPSARSLPGSGLGLAIVADIVRRHGGGFRATPARSRGTRIELHLPGAAPTPHPTTHTDR